MIDLASWLASARTALAEAAERPALEAQALLAAVLGKSKAWIFAHPEELIPPAHLETLSQLLSRRQHGEPLPYLLGHWEFYGMEFEVNPAVLIPRPETELMVDRAREWLQTHPAARRVVDVGTGSGCIAAALAHSIPEARIIATDISAQALAVARRNLAAHHLLGRVSIVQQDLISALGRPIDMICANLPYIPTETLATLPVAHYEPNLALDGGADGLRLVERLLIQACERMAGGGRLLIEIEFSQDSSAFDLARRFFPSAQITVDHDLADLPRLVIIDL